MTTDAAMDLCVLARRHAPPQRHQRRSSLAHPGRRLRHRPVLDLDLPHRRGDRAALCGDHDVIAADVRPGVQRRAFPAAVSVDPHRRVDGPARRAPRHAGLHGRRRDHAAALSGVPVDLGAGVPADVLRPVGIHGLARRPDHDRPVHVRQDRLCRPHELHHPHRASRLRAACGHQLGPRRTVGRLRADVAVGLRLGGVRAAAAEAAGRSRRAGRPKDGARRRARFCPRRRTISPRSGCSACRR